MQWCAVPIDRRTLVGTPSSVELQTIATGQYAHIGVSNALTTHLKQLEVVPDSVVLRFFVDGFSLNKANTRTAWIIMLSAMRMNFKAPPNVVGVYIGEKKPDSFNEMLEATVEEYLELNASGLMVNGKLVEIDLPATMFNLDAPAKTSCKMVSAVNSLQGCDICLAHGVSIDGRTTFPESNIPRRSDADYRSRIYGSYHHGLKAF